MYVKFAWALRGVHSCQSSSHKHATSFAFHFSSVLPLSFDRINSNCRSESGMGNPSVAASIFRHLYKMIKTMIDAMINFIVEWEILSLAKLEWATRLWRLLTIYQLKYFVLMVMRRRVGVRFSVPSFLSASRLRLKLAVDPKHLVAYFRGTHGWKLRC